MPMDADHDLELLALTLMDVLATVQSMRRTVTNAQAGIERLRHGRSNELLDDLKRCLTQLSNEVAIVGNSISTTTAPLTSLYDCA